MNRPPDSASSRAVTWGAGKRQLGYAVRRRIAALDPVEDNEEAARLTFEVLYGDPIAVHAGLLVGFSRQLAVPGLAGVMEQIHKRFAITDEQKLYTLATLIFEGERIGRHLGFNPFTANQREASWRFWRGVAEQMPLARLPPTAEELWRWMLDYEREHWSYTDDSRLVVERFFEDWTTRWFPRPMRGLGRQVLLALMDNDLRAVLHLEDPSSRIQWLARASARAYLPVTMVRPLPTGRSRMDHFARRP